MCSACAYMISFTKINALVWVNYIQQFVQNAFRNFPQISTISYA